MSSNKIPQNSLPLPPCLPACLPAAVNQQLKASQGSFTPGQQLVMWHIRKQTRAGREALGHSDHICLYPVPAGRPLTTHPHPPTNSPVSLFIL